MLVTSVTLLLALSIRTDSVIWRKSSGEVVKQVSYAAECRFRPYLPDERSWIGALPKGHLYDVNVDPNAQLVVHATPLHHPLHDLGILQD